MKSKKKTCRFKDIGPIEFTPPPLSPIRTNLNWDIFSDHANMMIEDQLGSGMLPFRVKNIPFHDKNFSILL